MRDFFISYNKADRAWAMWIAWQLEESDYSTYIQNWDSLPGTNWVEKMQQSIVTAQHTIAVLSPDYLASEFTQSEWQEAFARDPKGKKRILIPVRVRECTPEGLLKLIVRIDLVGLEEDVAKGKLLSGVKEGKRHKPENPPPYPEFPPSSSTTRDPQIREKPGFPNAKQENDKQEQVLIFRPNLHRYTPTNGDLHFNLLDYMRKRFASKGRSKRASNSLVEKILQPLRVDPQRKLELTISQSKDISLKWYPGHGRKCKEQKLTLGSEGPYKWRLYPAPLSNEFVHIITELDSSRLRLLLVDMKISSPLIAFHFSLKNL